MSDESNIRRHEAECASLFFDLASKMERVSIRMRRLLAHQESTDAHAEQLQGASVCVRQWGDRLRR